MYLCHFIGKVVLFKITEQFLSDACALLQPHDKTKSLYGKLVAVDGIGCWVENSSWKTIDAKTREQSQHLAQVLIPWHCLISAAAFPDRIFLGAPNEEEAKGIGFHANL
jgi:hypothetical protein